MIAGGVKPLHTLGLSSDTHIQDREAEDDLAN
jgi:hypothetical protein